MKVSRRTVASAAAVALIAGGSAAILTSRHFVASPTRPPPAMPPIPVSPAPQPSARARASTIIDLPGDPAVVSGAHATAPRPLLLAVIAQLAPAATREETPAFYVSEPLTPASGGYLSKFVEDGQQAQALGAELDLNASAAAGANADMGDDDDGGDQTPVDAEATQALTAANGGRLEIAEAGGNGRPQLKPVVLRPSIAEKISQALIESGYEPTSAAAVEDTTKRLFNIQVLRPGAIAVAVGALAPSGDYRIAQFALFEDGEYAGAVALQANGVYGEGAEPAIPPEWLDDAHRATNGERFDLADGVYSAGLRSAVPEPVVREAIRLLRRLADLDAPLKAGETLRLLYAARSRVTGEGSSRVIYAGLSGPNAVDCYAFAMSDGGFRCFVKEEVSSASKPATPAQAASGAPQPPKRERAESASLGDGGASASGGVLAPIRGAPITSLFGMRFHPILHIARLHAGIDFGAPVGSLVRAAADGVVESAGDARGYGDRVVLNHGGFETTYNHLSEVKVEVGARVRQGDIIALSGNSGLSTGPHLHFEYRVGGTPVDPLPHLGKEFQDRAPTMTASAASAVAGPPSAASRRDPPDPALLAAFAQAKADIDAALAEAQR